MIIVEKQTRFQPNTQLALAAIFGLGILSCLILCVAAFVLLINVLTIAFHAVGELAGALTSLYVQADSLGKIIIWLFAIFALVKLSPILARSARWSLNKCLLQFSDAQTPDDTSGHNA
jgi:hypothetical protein